MMMRRDVTLRCLDKYKLYRIFERQLGDMDCRTKFIQFAVEILLSTVKTFNSPIQLTQARHGPSFRKIHVKVSRLEQKSPLYTLQITFKTKYS